MSLDVSANSLTQESVSPLADMISKFDILDEVDLRDLMQLGGEFFGVLAHALQQSQSLLSLDLRGNPVSERSMLALLRGIETNHTLQVLKVDIEVSSKRQWFDASRRRKSMRFEAESERHECGFSTYKLLSMFEFFTNKEEIQL